MKSFRANPDDPIQEETYEFGLAGSADYYPAGGFFFLRDGLPLLLNTGSGEGPRK
jgi:hypothetical protein